MAITFPLALPAAPKPRKESWRPDHAVAMTRSPFTGQQHTQAHQAQLWSPSLTFPPMTRAQAAQFQAFILSLGGMAGSFLLGDGAAAVPRGIATGTPLVDGAGQTGQVLATKGWTGGQAGIMLAGDYLGLGSALTSRLYMLLADASSDGGGLAVFDIWPRLRESPADSAAIATTDTVGLFRLAANDVGWDRDEALHYGFTLPALENI